MDVRIEIHGHRNHEMTEEYTQQRIMDQLGKFPFISSCEIHISPSDNALGSHSRYKVKIETHLKGGAPTFSVAEDETENKALAAAILKTQRQLKKYKDRHYQKNS